MSRIAPMMEPRHASVDVARTVYNNKDVSKFRTCYDYAGMDVVQETGSRTCRATESLPSSMSLLRVQTIYKSDILIVTTWNSP